MINESDYLKMGWHLDRYHALEEDFLKFLDYITLDFYPKDDRKRIRSTYLADILLRVGSNVDIIFKKYISVNPEFIKIVGNKQEDKLNWGDYKMLEPRMDLSTKYVVLLPTGETIYPFKNSDGVNWHNISQKDTQDFWWKSYNKIKHNGSFEEANLDNTIQALAANFLLLLTDEAPLRKLVQYGYIHKKDNSIIDLEGKYDYIIYTKLFVNPEPINELDEDFD